MKGINLSKILSIFIALVAVIAAILFVRVFMADANAIKTDVVTQNNVVSPLVSFSTYLLYLAIGVTVLLSLWSMIKNPENLKKTLLGVLVLGVVLVVAYFFADSNAITDAQGFKILEGGEEGSATNKWAGTGIWFSLFLGIIATGFFVFDLAKGLIKS
jgi:glucan phosphoethanolaminetransferase (alkaline phosphatase superfamily)